MKPSISLLKGKVRTYICTGLISCVLIVPTSYAIELGYSSWEFNPLADAYNRTLLQNEINYENWYGKAKKSGKKSSKQSTKTSQSKTTQTKTTQTKVSTKKVTNADRYTPSANITAQVNKEMINAIRQSFQANGALNNQSQAELNRLANANLIGQAKQALKSDGYDPNSVATAMAFWVVVNYGISQRADLSKLKAHTMVNQLKEVMSDDLAGVSNADKQKMSEMLYWYGILQMASYLDAVQKNNSSAINSQVSQARIGLSNMGLSVSNIKNSGNQLSLQ